MDGEFNKFVDDMGAVKRKSSNEISAVKPFENKCKAGKIL